MDRPFQFVFRVAPTSTDLLVSVNPFALFVSLLGLDA